MRLSGAQRAAVIVSQFGDEEAMALLHELTEAETVRVLSEVARLPPLRSEDVAEVLSDFLRAASEYAQVRQGGFGVAKHWMTERLGSQKADELLPDSDEMQATSALRFLNQVDPGQILRYLSEEHPQTIAVVVSNLRQDVAAHLLDQMGEETAAEILRRIAKLSPVPASAVKVIAESLELRVAPAGGFATGEQEAGGISTAAHVLSNVSGVVEEKILAHIEAIDPDLAEKIRAEMFVFEDVVALESLDLQVALRNVTTKDLALALRTASSDVKQKFFENMSERSGVDLAEEIEMMSGQRVRVSAVEAAKEAIIRTVRELAESGEITVGRSGDEFV